MFLSKRSEAKNKFIHYDSSEANTENLLQKISKKKRRKLNFEVRITDLFRLKFAGCWIITNYGNSEGMRVLIKMSQDLFKKIMMLK